MPYNPNGKKSGPLSKAEIKTIKYNLDMTDLALANKLNRPTETIAKYREQIQTVNYVDETQKIKEADVNTTTVKDLKKSPEWEILKQQLSKEELSFYQYKYNQLVGQFQHDVLVTENIQLSQAIMFEIIMNRILKDMQANVSRLGDLKTLFEDLKKQGMGAAESGDSDQALQCQSMQMEVQASIAGLESKMKEDDKRYSDIQDKQAKLLGHLKATRNQRLEKIEKAGDSFLDMVKYLEDRENQVRESRYIELVNAAVKKEKERMMANHEFADNTVHPILMTPENTIAHAES